MRKSHVGIASVLRLYCIGAFFALPALPALAGEFSAAQNPRPECPADFFVKSAVIFDSITICGTKSVPDDKLSHAAQVAAQWLDNDQNGRVDEPRLLAKLYDNQPVLVMSARGFRSRAIDKIMDRLGKRIGQDLAADETAPSRRDERDASQEEIHHLIVNAGWIPLAPQLFSDRRAVRFMPPGNRQRPSGFTIMMTGPVMTAARWSNFSIWQRPPIWGRRLMWRMMNCGLKPAPI